jgi:hypothetical protein
VSLDKRLPAQYAGHLRMTGNALLQLPRVAKPAAAPREPAYQPASQRQPLHAVQPQQHEQRQQERQQGGCAAAAGNGGRRPALSWRLDKDDVASVFVKLRAHLMGAAALYSTASPKYPATRSQCEPLHQPSTMLLTC